MRILFLSAFVPSLRTAGQNYSRLLLQELSRKSSIDLILFRNSKSDMFEPVSNNVCVKRYYTDTKCSKLLNCLFGLPFFPFFTSRFSLSRILYINRLIKRECYDVVYFDFSQIFIYGLFLSKSFRGKIVYMSHDVITQKYERVGNYVVSFWVNKTERFLLKGVDDIKRKIYTFSTKDVEYMYAKLALKANSTNFFIDKIVIEAVPVMVKSEYILFGAWGRPENRAGLLWFLDFWEKKDFNSEDKIVIIGGGLERSIVRRVSSMCNVSYEGFVNNPYIRIANAKALIAPLFQGAGVKVKVIEALACGTPVIGTPVALEGIPFYMNDALFCFENAYDLSKMLKAGVVVDLDTKLRIKRIFISKYVEKNILNEFS